MSLTAFSKCIGSRLLSVESGIRLGNFFLILDPLRLREHLFNLVSFTCSIFFTSFVFFTCNEAPVGSKHQRPQFFLFSMSVDKMEMAPQAPENLLLESSEPSKEEPTVTSIQEIVPFSIYTPRQKVCLATFAGLLALLSPLSANIYFPVLPQLAEHYGKSNSAINLSITM